MPQTNFEEFQELVEQFEAEMSLKAICEQDYVAENQRIFYLDEYFLLQKANLYLMQWNSQTMKHIFTFRTLNLT